MADLERGLQLTPDEGIALTRRATILAHQRKFDLAAEDFERALKNVPNDGPTHLQYGILLYETHDLERALAQFDVATRLTPRDPFAWAWRAQANQALRRFDQVKADEGRVDELGVAGEDAIHARENVVDVLEEGQDFAGAAQALRRFPAIEQDQRSAVRLVRALWYSGQFGDAVAFFRERAVAPMSGDYVPLWLFVMRGRADPAAEPEAKAELAASALVHRPRVWTDTLVDLLQGRTNLDAALAEADAAPSYQLKAGRRCEADYYAAEWLLMHGEGAKARALLDEAYWVCPESYLEAMAVAAERRTLDGSTTLR